MDNFDGGSAMIAGLAAAGLLLIVVSLVLNARVAHNVRIDLKHREKLLEYHRNMLSQLGVILLGIGISLSVFYFQQNYQEQARRKAEVQQTLAKLGLQVARGVALMPSLAEFDLLLDSHGPYENPYSGTEDPTAYLAGDELATVIRGLRLVQVDVEPHDFEQMNISRILESTFIVNELDPALWFNIVKDESSIHYAVAQLVIDERDLGQVVGDADPDAIAADPEKAKAAKQQILEIYYDADVLRKSSRRLLARTCWMLSSGRGLVDLSPQPSVEAEMASHRAWLMTVYPDLKLSGVGTQDCYSLLGYPQDE